MKHLLAAHAAYWADEAAMAEGNPQRIVERGAFTQLPPLLVIQGTKDDNLTDDMADRFVDAYRAAGGDATLEKIRRQAARVRHPRAGRRHDRRMRSPRWRGSSARGQ